MLSRSTVRMAGLPSQQPGLLAYKVALELVDATRGAGNIGLANYYLEQVVEQVPVIPDPVVLLLHGYLDHVLLEKSKLNRVVNTCSRWLLNSKATQWSRLRRARARLQRRLATTDTSA